MNYITIKQAAQKWNVTTRRVQELCKKGSIPGAARFGHAWILPEDAPKPPDGRTKQKKQPEPMLPRKNPLLLYTDLYNTPGTAEAVLESLESKPEVQKILRCQFDYQQGNIQKVYDNTQFLLNVGKDFHSVISAGITLARAAMWRGDIALWRRARQHIFEAPCANEAQRQVLECWVAINDSAIYDTRDFPDWFGKGKFHRFAADSYPAARVFYVKYLFIQASYLATRRVKLEDVDGMGLMRTLPYIMEPMICQAKIERTVVPEIYLHLMVATVYHDLGDDQSAISHIDEAIALSLPDELYGALVEYRTNLGNLLDDRLALQSSEALKRMTELHRQMVGGWVKLHNTVLQRTVASHLTVREREVAKLAAFGFTNAQIAKRLHIEVNSVKYFIFCAMNKVGAEKRTELGQYVY